MNEISDKIKQQIPRLVGNEVKKLIKRNIDDYDDEAVNYAGKSVEKKIERYLGLPPSIVISKKISDKSNVKYKIKGAEKTLANILKGESVSEAVGKNIRVSVELNIHF